MRNLLPRLVAVPLLALVAGCGASGGSPSLPYGSEPADLDPAQFVATIDNPYLPYVPGNSWVYRERGGDGGEQRVEVTVTDRTKRILGIDATVVHDVVTEGGKLVEDTYDWYAQDRDGNVWYLGEDTKEYEDGEVVTTAGSWEAGVDGAEAGIVMPADPAVGQRYRQEYLAGEAEDEAEVLSVDEQAKVPYGSFTGLVLTADSTPLQPDILEHKFYARGVGLVLAKAVSGGGGREELVRFTAAP